MSHWNFRVVHRRHPIPGDGGYEDIYAIHEAYYDDDGNLTGVTENPTPLMAETLKGLKEQRMWMFVAMQKPVVEWDDLGRKNKRETKKP